MRCADPHFLAGGAVLHRVVEQVEEHLPHRAGIGGHDEVLRYLRSDRRATRRCERRKAVDHLLHQRRERSGLGRDVRRLPLRAREVQQVLDEMGQAPSLLVDDRQRAAALFVGSNPSECQGLREHADLREWRPELVRNARDEVGAQPGQLGLAAQLEQRSADQRRGQPQQAEDQRQPRLGQASDDQLIGHRCA